MIARGFRPVGWVAALGIAALGCYMLSLRVAAERADVASLDRKIVAVQRSIRSLQTEVGTRSRIPQLEDWNNDVLALAAPVSGQFLGGNVSLARFDMRASALPDQAEIRLASAAAPAPALQQAASALAPQQAAPTPSAVPAAPAVQRAVAAAAPAQRPELRRASLTVAAPAPAPVKPRAEPAPAPTRTAAGEERSRPAAPPVRTASAVPQRPRPAPVRASARAAAAPARQARNANARPLLGDGTLRDLGNVSRGERERGKHD